MITMKNFRSAAYSLKKKNILLEMMNSIKDHLNICAPNSSPITDKVSCMFTDPVIMGNNIQSILYRFYFYRNMTNYRNYVRSLSNNKPIILSEAFTTSAPQVETCRLLKDAFNKSKENYDYYSLLSYLSIQLYLPIYYLYQSKLKRFSGVIIKRNYGSYELYKLVTSYMPNTAFIYDFENKSAQQILTILSNALINSYNQCIKNHFMNSLEVNSDSISYYKITDMNPSDIKYKYHQMPYVSIDIKVPGKWYNKGIDEMILRIVCFPYQKMLMTYDEPRNNSIILRSYDPDAPLDLIYESYQNCSIDEAIKNLIRRLMNRDKIVNDNMIELNQYDLDSCPYEMHYMYNLVHHKENNRNFSLVTIGNVANNLFISLNDDNHLYGYLFNSAGNVGKAIYEVKNLYQVKKAYIESNERVDVLSNLDILRIKTNNNRMKLNSLAKMYYNHNKTIIVKIANFLNDLFRRCLLEAYDPIVDSSNYEDINRMKLIPFVNGTISSQNLYVYGVDRDFYRKRIMNSGDNTFAKNIIDLIDLGLIRLNEHVATIKLTNDRYVYLDRALTNHFHYRLFYREYFCNSIPKVKSKLRKLPTFDENNVQMISRAPFILMSNMLNNDEEIRRQFIIIVKELQDHITSYKYTEEYMSLMTTITQLSKHASNFYKENIRNQIDDIANNCTLYDCNSIESFFIQAGYYFNCVISSTKFA